MKRLLRRFAPLTTALVAVSMMAPSSAYASVSATAQVNGGGNISPGLTTTPRPQPSVTFSGSIRAVIHATIGTGAQSSANTLVADGSVSFTGHSTIDEWVVQGGGTGTVSGSATVTGTIHSLAFNGAVSGTTTISGSIDYTRVGAEVTITGSITLSTSVCAVAPAGGCWSISQSGAVAGAFQFAPTSVDPTTSYVLAGTATVAGL